MNETIHATILGPGIWAGIAVFLALLVMGKDTPTERGWKFWQWSPHASFRLKALAIIGIGATAKSLLDFAFGDQGNAWGDVVMNLNSAIAGAYAARGWVIDTSKQTSGPEAESTPHCVAASTPSISLTDEIDSTGNRKIALTYQMSKINN